MILWLPRASVVKLCRLRINLTGGFLGFLPLLRTLDLSENPLLKSEALEAVAECNSLEIIDVSHCNALHTLAPLSACQKLTTILARDCLGFTATAKDESPLICNATVTSIDLHECDALLCLTV